MKSEKKVYFTVLSLILGGFHFLISLLIVPATLWAGNSSLASPVKEQLLSLLHIGTKIVYFPIISSAFYPRYWFPGPWIHIPILVNSLVWGALMAGITVGWRRLRHNHSPGNAC